MERGELDYGEVKYSGGDGEWEVERTWMLILILHLKILKDMLTYLMIYKYEAAVLILLNTSTSGFSLLNTLDPLFL